MGKANIGYMDFEKVMQKCNMKRFGLAGRNGEYIDFGQAIERWRTGKQLCGQMIFGSAN